MLEAAGVLGAISEQDKDGSPAIRVNLGLGLLLQGISAATDADRRALLAERGELLLQVLLLLARAAAAEGKKQQQQELKDEVGRSWILIKKCLEEINGLRILGEHARECSFALHRNHPCMWIACLSGGVVQAVKGMHVIRVNHNAIIHAC